jgi:hypothetical protein
MKNLSLQFKKYASGALLLLVLLAPLQSSAALLAKDVEILRVQVALLTKAIESSSSITEAKKSELRGVVSSIDDIIEILSAQVAANPDAESQRRVNIEDIIVTGDANDFGSRVQIVWGPEQVGATTYERSTSTYNYDFVTTLAQDEKTERLSELSNLTFSQLAAELGFSASRLKATATISFKRFEDELDAKRTYVRKSVGDGLEKYFGQYSIINDVFVTTGKDLFSISVQSDQNETLTLTLTPNTVYCDRGDLCRSRDGYSYEITYAIYDEVKARVSNTKASRVYIKAQLLDVLSGIGIQFNVPDEVLVEEFIDFILNNTVIYKTESKAEQVPGVCHSTKIQGIVSQIVYYYASKFQVIESDDENPLVRVGPPVDRVMRDQNQSVSGCFGQSDPHFLMLPQHDMLPEEEAKDFR